MSSPKSSINLSYLHAVFTNCTSFKPLCTKEYAPSNGRGSLCKNFFPPFSAWLYLFTRNVLKRRHFLEVWYGAQAVGASASHEISHIRRRFSALACVSQKTRKLLGPESFSGLLRNARLSTKQSSINLGETLFQITRE